MRRGYNKLRNTIYNVEAVLNVKTIPEKIVNTMATYNWEKYVKRAENALANINAKPKRTKLGRKGEIKIERAARKQARIKAWRESKKDSYINSLTEGINKTLFH